MILKHTSAAFLTWKLNYKKGAAFLFPVASPGFLGATALAGAQGGSCGPAAGAAFQPPFLRETWRDALSHRHQTFTSPLLPPSPSAHPYLSSPRLASPHPPADLPPHGAAPAGGEAFAPELGYCDPTADPVRRGGRLK